MSEFEDNLWQEVVRDCGHELAQLGMPRGHRGSRARGGVLAGRTAAAAGVALVVGLASVLVAGSTHNMVRKLAPGAIRTASFTLQHRHNGTYTLVINPREVFDPAALESDLAKYGIPAKVTSGSFCSSDPAPAGFLQVLSFSPPGEPVTPQSGVQPTITFDPSAMPAGTQLSFGYFQLATREQRAYVALIDTNSFTCASTPPTQLGPASLGVSWVGP